MAKPYFAFTSYNTKGIAREIKSKVIVSSAFDPQQTTKHPTTKEFVAIWDTGATGSVISDKVVDECGLEPIGIANVHTTEGTGRSNVYLVNFILPNRVGIPRYKVTEGKLLGADVLIGMDIISQGDFAVTKKEGKTTFSFRIPSQECIDFVEQKPEPPSPIIRTSRKVGRNDPCPCNSGKKYKKCCAKEL